MTTRQEAAIIAVGTELLGSDRLDTNSSWLAGALDGLGIRVVHKQVVGDGEEDLVRALRHASSLAALVITTGGLGPTEDDVTRPAVAGFLGRKLRFEPAILSGIEARFRAHGLSLSPNNRCQALVPNGASWLPNPAGTAPALVARRGKKILLALPGPPREIRAIWPSAREAIARLLGGDLGPPPIRRTLKLAGIAESRADSLAAPIYRRFRSIETTILFSEGTIELRLTAHGSDARRARRSLDRLVEKLRTRLARYYFGEGDETLEGAIVSRLTDLRKHVALAESCTGGLISHRLTQVQGASRVLDLALVTYANWAKQSLLRVTAATLRNHGAVSEPCAREMAIGARKRGRADYGLSVTGIAGPTGGSEEKPLGTTYIGLATPTGCRVKHLRILGDRDRVQTYAATIALNLLRLEINKTGDPPHATT